MTMPVSRNFAGTFLKKVKIMSEVIDQKEILVFNKNAIAAILTSLGINSVTVEYSGSGDSHNGLDIHFWPEGSTKPSAVVTLKEIQGSYDASRPADDRWTYKVEDVDRDLEEAMSAFVDSLLKHFGHEGFYNGGGGYGTVELFANGKLEFSHSDYVIEEDTTTYELDENLNSTEFVGNLNSTELDENLNSVESDENLNSAE